ncbi:endoplasmic reticulum lectin 1 [Coccinella septempunctata]|uniref:endoplasmic reticulum lectin 1 n=1 Tax=Coccinella septempunctata TaxID=41139 RepID=UPI001D070349|nr:endoplasmic reticulum lectin 1 [Coccinella septempunctata]
MKYLDLLFIHCFYLQFGVNTAEHSLRGFDDTVLFDINWVDSNSKDLELMNGESIIVTSSHQEKYKCHLPKIQEKDSKENQDKYEGPTALELIAPLFSQSLCSYRLESYWTYEVCHGKFVRQYHEDREGKKTKLQEYILGKWNDEEYNKLLKEFQQTENEMGQIPVKKIENVNLPYLEIHMGNGTTCDLNNNKPRETRALYVCYAHGKHDVYSLKETSTCQYELVILSPLLCSHPKYKPKESGEHPINCTPIEGSTVKPYNLAKLKAQSKQLRMQSEFEGIRITPIDLTEREFSIISIENAITDTSPVENFLAGKNCLTGGTGWWRYEFCYGKSVEQYHIEKDGTKISINLGIFMRDKHIEWLKDHPQKRPKSVSQRKQLSHFYSNGEICDKTGKPRQTEVKLKCLENTSNLNAVSLYLLEPRYCEYILGVESPLICKILSRVDENGLVPLKLSDNSDIIGE